ncbi:hypothetical protein BH23BAC3_BH23BAC3_18130 [soil metagenome]
MVLNKTLNSYGIRFYIFSYQNVVRMHQNE